MSKRNMIILTICRCISAIGAVVMVTIGAVLGSQLSGSQELATLPVSAMVVSMAATTIPATMLMRRIGRRFGFALASLSAATSVLVAAFALSRGSFPIFTAATALFGINMAFTQQYRYAAAESADPDLAAKAISLVLLGSIGGALVGPELVMYGQHALGSIEYLGTLVALGAIYLAQAALFLVLGPMRGEQGTAERVQRPRRLREIASQPVFLTAVLGGTVAYGVMTFIMTATPLSMHVHDGFSMDQTAQVIRGHVLGMYVPSLVSGYLISRLGVVRMMSLGGMALAAACGIGMMGQSYMHYWYALVLLGVGWNFLYVGGTALLTRTYRLEERFQAQAVNEFSVFGASAAASLVAGVVIYRFGWFVLVMAPLPALALIFASLYGIRKAELAAPSWVKPEPVRAG